jgi:hypothetical protein
MKKILPIILLVLTFSSCKKFLDVKPESEIDKNELFTTEAGFKEALNGVYLHCSGNLLYGGHMTFGMLDIMAQNYKFTDVNYQQIAGFNYASEKLTSDSRTVWEQAYRGIANTNYILNTIDERKALFNNSNYELIKGEALALRAYLHFDMLRMFAPSFTSKPLGKAIPYVKIVTSKNTPFSNVTEVLDLAIADLEEAKILLSTSDPILSSGYKVGYPDDPNSNELNFPDLFLQNRRHRINYYAVCAELARVYLYKADFAKALLNAKIIIDSKKFPFTNVDDFIHSDLAKRDRILYKELIASWYIPNAKDMLINLYAKESPDYSATVTQIDEIYEKRTFGAEDNRYKQWFINVKAQQSGEDRALLQKYVVNSAPMANLHPLVAPALRLSEMYYIAAEAVYDQSPQEALVFYNTVRRNRGIPDDLTSVTSKTEFVDLLILEARKEFYGESQMFFMYKRLNHAVKVSETQSITPSDKIFVFPVPATELNTNK